eukprot:2904693-Rhodomonas_salina.1
MPDALGPRSDARRGGYLQVRKQTRAVVALMRESRGRAGSAPSTPHPFVLGARLSRLLGARC